MEVDKENLIEAEKTVRIKKLRNEIEDIKDRLKTDFPSRAGNPNLGSLHQGNRWKPGENGDQHGIPKVRIKFWSYVVGFLDMLMVEVNGIDNDTLTLGQLGAKKFALNVAEGRWAHTKEVIDRELGHKSEGQDAEEENKPRLIKLPFKMEVPA